jgi:hypothetical protein
LSAALALDRGWLGGADVVGAAGVVAVAAVAAVVVVVIMGMLLEELKSRGLWGLLGLGLVLVGGSVSMVCLPGSPVAWRRRYL